MPPVPVRHIACRVEAASSAAVVSLHGNPPAVKLTPASLPEAPACFNAASADSAWCQASTDPVHSPAAPGAVAAAMGVTLHADVDGGGASFRVWAPHARTAAVEVQGGDKMPLQRDGDCWAARVGPGNAPVFIMSCMHFNHQPLTFHASSHMPFACKGGVNACDKAPRYVRLACKQGKLLLLTCRPA